MAHTRSSFSLRSTTLASLSSYTPATIITTTAAAIVARATLRRTASSTVVLCHDRPYSSGLRPKGPGPIPLEDARDQAEFERLIKNAESGPATYHPDAKMPVPQEFDGDTNPETGEVGGPKREPVRFGDWSFKGRVTDF
ncbi:putative mitochondrial protein, conserved [Mortierella claussenii]|nr:putative mitochondrial protein, conserved [Mortierella claussenii]